MEQKEIDEMGEFLSNKVSRELKTLSRCKKAIKLYTAYHVVRYNRKPDPNPKIEIDKENYNIRMSVFKEDQLNKLELMRKIDKVSLDELNDSLKKLQAREPADNTIFIDDLLSVLKTYPSLHSEERIIADITLETFYRFVLDQRFISRFNYAFYSSVKDTYLTLLAEKEKPKQQEDDLEQEED